LPTFKSGLAVSANSAASKAGANIMKRGGNAIDAAVTMAHVIGVAAPAFSGIGGGGFALIWLAKEEKPIFVDFRERAPLAANENLFKLTPSGSVASQENAVGYMAIAIPAAISGHASILEKYGTLKFGDTLEEAARIAKRGFRVDRALAYVWKLGHKKLRRFQESNSTYLKRSRPYREGDEIVLPSLARTLTTIQRRGIEEFYTGPLGRTIVSHVASNKGIITSRDLEEFQPTTRNAIRGSYKDYEIISAPPPSAGGATILQTLNILESFRLNSYGAGSAAGLHILAEALARSSLSCRTTISDPDFTNPNLDELVSKAVAKEQTATISMDHSSMPTQTGMVSGMPASNTTHLVAIDAERNIVSLTESLECYFGSGITVPGTGMLLNDTMHDFDPQPHRANSVASRKIPMSSMSPTIVLKGGRPMLALGSAGGPRIISSTLQALLNVIEFDMSLREAVAAPRIHLDGTKIQMEPAIGGTAARELRSMGHSIQIKNRTGKEDTGLYFGAAQISEDGTLSGASDPRRDGLTTGLP
jgi:gamma-glutamyltranspeptidase/glutathione hydrolase